MSNQKETMIKYVTNKENAEQNINIMNKDRVVLDKEQDGMSRNAEYIHLKLKPQMDGLKGKSDKAKMKNSKLEDKALRKIPTM